jgi:hypothetical protein
MPLQVVVGGNTVRGESDHSGALGYTGVSRYMPNAAVHVIVGSLC